MLTALFATLTATALAACFAPPQPVEIAGWTADAMEPFVSRDGGLLFFNSSNAPGRQTDIYWARRVDALHFTLQGKVPGANSSALDGVPSLARNGTFSLVSPRAYDKLHATLWIGRWTGAAVEDLQPQPLLAPPGPGRFNMDAEISADGRRLYFTNNQWALIGPPKTSTFRMARLTPDGWRVDAAADRWFSQINGPGLQYAAGISDDDLDFFFTRLTMAPGAPPKLEIMVATRTDPSAPFSAPVAIPAISGFVEAPSVAPDGALYFHARRGNHFEVERSANGCRS